MKSSKKLLEESESFPGLAAKVQNDEISEAEREETLIGLTQKRHTLIATLRKRRKQLSV